MTTDTTDTITTAAAENTEHMETITYQGQPVQAQLVNFISGDYTTSTVDCSGDEQLFRDEAGRYYLRRKLDWFDMAGPKEREGSGLTHDRETVHRVNVNAAILWAITRLNSVTHDLRQDAANLLMEGRGYFDPHPSHLSAGQRAMLADSSRFATAPVPIPDPATQPALGLADLDEHTRGLLAEFVAEHPGCHPRDAFNGVLAQILECELRDRSEYTDVFVAEARERRLAQEQAGKASGKSAAPGRVMVELDELASTMLRRVCRHGSECREAGEDPRDLVNAAVTFYLCGDHNSQQGEFDLNDAGDALDRAKADRLAAGGKETL